MKPIDYGTYSSLYTIDSDIYNQIFFYDMPMKDLL